MDTRWKKFSHSIITKAIAYLIAILCFAGAITVFVDFAITTQGDFDVVFEKSYYQSREHMNATTEVVDSICDIVETYKSEEHVLNGGTLREEEIKREEEQLFEIFVNTSKSYNPNLTHEENYQLFLEVYADKISQIRDELIQENLRKYNWILGRLEKHPDLYYYIKKGENEFTNSPNNSKEYFQTFPAYMVVVGIERGVFPEEINNNPYYYRLNSRINRLGQQDKLYIGFTEKYLSPRIAKWENNKNLVADSTKQIAAFLLGLAVAFTYLVLVIGRKPQDTREINLNSFDRIYNDIKGILCLALIGIWVAFMDTAGSFNSYEFIFPITLVIAVPGLILALSLVKHIKNRTFLKHTLIYTIFAKLFGFLKEVYNSGSVGVKVVLIIIAYPLLVGATFFMFPITIGAAVWLSLKKIKEFNAIKEGVKQVKTGDLRHTINVSGNGEFARLAVDINSITDGLNHAVASEIKSERLKTELITNVSHDIRTPLTSIITYLDLLKNEKDESQREEYLEILDQKSQRLKILTDDLFEAAKAASGNIPVSLEKIDLISLITQGLGELDDRIQERKLSFKINHPKEKVFIRADGKLFWRALENLFSNIFKYAQEGSRVYVDIIDSGTSAMLTIKNISAYELNISADELMERFKRGDESRSSQGSGLGLSIAKSLIEIQKGEFKIEIDGDLFKAVIKIPK